VLTSKRVRPMVAKKKEPTFAAQSEQRIAEDGSFPHSVEPPVRARWERALTEKYGKRGKAWTTTKSEPQWMVRFRDGDAAVWFKKTGQRKSSGAAPKRIVSADFRPRAAQRGFWRRPPRSCHAMVRRCEMQQVVLGQ
jgi:hypothetical protein